MLMVKKAMVMPWGETPEGISKYPHLHTVADDIGGQSDDGDKHALIHHIEAQATGEDAVVAIPGRTVHNIRLRLLQAQGQAGKQSV